MEKSLDPDIQTREQVLAALTDDDRTADAVIEVVSEQGVVTLSGRVESNEVREAAEQIASAQPGVNLVVNDLALAVRGEEQEPLADAPEAAEVAAFDSRAPYIPTVDESDEEA